MHTANSTKWFLAFAMAAMACVASAQQSKPVDDKALKNAAKNADEWLTNGHDLGDQRYSPLKQIDTIERETVGPRVVLRRQQRLRNRGNDSHHLGRSAVRHGAVEHRLRTRRRHRQRALALGPENWPPEFPRGIHRQA